MYCGVGLCAVRNKWEWHDTIKDIEKGSGSGRGGGRSKRSGRGGGGGSGGGRDRAAPPDNDDQDADNFPCARPIDISMSRHTLSNSARQRFKRI